jgi:hypothetical protein
LKNLFNGNLTPTDYRLKSAPGDRTERIGNVKRNNFHFDDGNAVTMLLYETYDWFHAMSGGLPKSCGVSSESFGVSSESCGASPGNPGVYYESPGAFPESTGVSPENFGASSESTGVSPEDTGGFYEMTGENNKNRATINKNQNDSNIPIEERRAKMRENVKESVKSNMRKDFSLRMETKCLRRAAVGRCTPIGSRSLRSVRRLIENLSNGGRPRSREASAVQRATLPVRPPIENLFNGGRRQLR